MNEYERRQEAVRRVAQGEPISSVCADLGRTRAWYYKWRERYRRDGLAGLEDQQPGHAPQRIPKELQELIVEIRDRLVRQAEEGTHHLGIGANQIAQELRGLDLTRPSPRTIYRILQAAERTTKDNGPKGYRQRPTAVRANDVHQLDFWPRVLEGGTWLYLIHLVDVATWYPCGQVSEDKTTDSVLAFLLTSWQALGVPRVLQVDNEMSFTGGRWISRLGRMVRLALLLGCEVWFNPFYMPECNAYVERFHGLCDQFFWTRHHFTGLADISQPYREFLQTFREEHTPESLAGQTPTQRRQALPDHRVVTLPQGLTWTAGRSLPLVTGRVHCLRRTDSQARLQVLGRYFTLDARYRRSYVRATLTVADQQVAFYYQETADQEPELVDVRPFPLPEPIELWDNSLYLKYLA